jgi:hypothetical protein
MTTSWRPTDWFRLIDFQHDALTRGIKRLHPRPFKICHFATSCYGVATEKPSRNFSKLSRIRGRSFASLTLLQAVFPMETAVVVRGFSRSSSLSKQNWIPRHVLHFSQNYCENGTGVCLSLEHVWVRSQSLNLDTSDVRWLVCYIPYNCIRIMWIKYKSCVFSMWPQYL